MDGKRPEAVKLALDGVDAVDVVVLQKKVNRDVSDVVNTTDVIDCCNVYHQGVMFRFKSRECEYRRNVFVELRNRLGPNVVAPALPSTDAIDEVDRAMACERAGCGYRLDAHEHVDVRAEAFAARYEMGTFVQTITPDTMRRTWEFICDYRRLYGPLYAIANVALEPTRVAGRGYDRGSYVERLRHCLLDDNTCVSFVNRVLNYCCASDVPGVFLPFRNYASWFVRDEAVVRRIDTDSPAGVREVVAYYARTRERLAPHLGGDLTTKLAHVLRHMHRLRFEYVVVPSWNRKSQRIEYYRIEARDLTPFVGYEPHQLHPLSARNATCHVLRPARHAPARTALDASRTAWDFFYDDARPT